MKIAVIHGTVHKGSTYHSVQIFLDEMKKRNPVEVTEFFMPKDMPSFCVGCFNCIGKNENLCPHFASVEPIAAALEQADIIVLASPVYVYDVSGQMKALLDHFAYRWMVHRPHPSMFKKVGVVISTSAGGGNKPTSQTMARNLMFWGVKRIFSYGVAVQAAEWKGVNEKKRAKINANLSRMADKVSRTAKKAHKLPPTLKTWGWFMLVKTLVKMDNWNKPDKEHWQQQGWLSGGRPWRS